MSEEMNHDLLKATAEESKKDAEKKTSEVLQSNPEEYTPRPLFQRIWAWILLVVVLVGVALWYYWIARG